VNPLVWIQSLLTFRKQGGGFSVPELDGAGRIRVSLLSESPIVVGAVAPAVIDGSVLWYNTTTSLMMFYDISRSKWLSTESHSLAGGRNGATAVSGFYRGQDGMVLDATTRGLPCRTGTLTSISWSKTSAGSSTLEVLANGAVIAELNSNGVGVVRDDTVNADFSSGLMSFRNKAGLVATSNVQIVVHYRLR